MPLDAPPPSAALLSVVPPSVVVPSAVAPTLHRVDEAVRIVREVRVCLGDLAARAAGVAENADWHAPSARAFHEGLERWTGRVRNAQGYADEAIDALQRGRAGVVARAVLP